MKKLITTYIFVPEAQTVQLTGLDSVDIKGLLLITNVTDNLIIYNFADPLKGGTVAGNTITLTYDTVAMDAGDDLQIFYDDADYEVNLATEAKQDDIVTAISNKDIMLALKMLYHAIVNPPWIDKTANQLRAQVTGTLTTVTTVTGITNFNSYAANLLIIDQNRAAWASVVRSRIA